MNRSRYCFFILCAFRLTIGAAQDVELKAKVVNEATNDAVSFANIKFKNYDFGTACDETGNFVININPSLMNDTIQFTALGFKLSEIPVKEFIKANQEIVKLKEQPMVLSEVVISGAKSDWPIQLINQVIDSIPKNYVMEPYLAKTLITSNMDKYGIHLVSNLSAQIYFSTGYDNKRKKDDKFVMDGSCLQQYDNTTGSLSNNVIAKIGLNPDILGFYIRDFVSRREDNFLNKKNVRSYSFDLESEDKFQLVIRFKSNSLKTGIVPFMYLKAFSGRIYIRKKDYAIMKFETHAIVSESAMKRSLNKSKVGEIEVTTEYRESPSGKLYWTRSSYKENYLNNTEAVNVNTFLRTGVQTIKADDYSHKNQNLCKN